METLREEEEKWKKQLRENLCEVFSANNQNLFFEIGMAYQCCAPASLFKYYSNSDRNLLAVMSNQMWYSAPCNFNDVFDCDISFDSKAMLDSLVAVASETHTVRVGSPVWRNFREQVHKGVGNLKETLANMKNTIGIACLSEQDDSLLMWAHYANNHRGMCVEYELLEINRQLKFTPVPIIYNDQRVCFSSLNPTNLHINTNRVFFEGLTSKSPVWSYEKEWRIIRDDAACGNRWDTTQKGALLPMIRPSSITVGCEASEQFQNHVQEYCEANHINMFRMEKDKLQYRLIKKSILCNNVGTNTCL